MRIAVLVLATVLGHAAAGYADEAPSPGPAPSLESHLEEYDRLEAALIEARAQLQAVPAGAARRQLQARIRALEQAQDQVVAALEQLVGPLPPAVRPDRPSLLDQQRRSQEQRQDSVLERDVDQRLKQ